MPFARSAPFFSGLSFPSDFLFFGADFSGTLSMFDLSYAFVTFQSLNVQRQKLTVLRTIGMKWKTAKDKQVTILRRQS